MKRMFPYLQGRREFSFLFSLSIYEKNVSIYAEAEMVFFLKYDSDYFIAEAEFHEYRGITVF